MQKADDSIPFTVAAIRSQAVDRPARASKLNGLATRIAGQYKSNVISPIILSGMWRIFEFATLSAISLLTICIYDRPQQDDFSRYLLLSLSGAMLGVICIAFFGGYRIGTLRRKIRQMPSVLIGWSVALTILALVLFFLKAQDDVSRLWLAVWLVAGMVALCASRLLLSVKLRQWARNGIMERRVVIVGGGDNAETFIRELEAQPDNDIRICGIFDDRAERRSPSIVAGYPKLGTVHELVEFARITRIDMLIVTLPLSAEKRVLALLRDLWVLPLDIRLSTQGTQLRFRPQSYSFIGKVPLLDIFDRPIANWDAIAKRVFDLAIAGLALFVLSPVLAATAIAIKLDSAGPVIFRQKRHGFNNQIIDVLKFRSMYHDMADPAARRVVTRGDPRVTRVGRFIRKTSLDELPQLWNVIKGELSLVGPRPHAVHAISSNNEAFIEIFDGYFGRHRVKPGITGWAQVNGYRGEIDRQDKLKKRVEHDLHYIENWSIALDCMILAMTPISLLKTENAY